MCYVKYVTLFFACGVVISGKLKEERTAMSAVYQASFSMMKWLGCEVAWGFKSLEYVTQYFHACCLGIRAVCTLLKRGGSP
jgi:hypothetical protein